MQHIFILKLLTNNKEKKKKTEKILEQAMFATSSVWQLGQTKDERRKRKNQQIGTEMPRMYNVKQIQHEREKYKICLVFSSDE